MTIIVDVEVVRIACLVTQACTARVAIVACVAGHVTHRLCFLDAKRGTYSKDCEEREEFLHKEKEERGLAYDHQTCLARGLSTI